MADKLTATFTSADAAKTAHAELIKADPTSKKKLYSVTLPSVEAYANFLKTQGASTFYMSTDGYASTAYTILRYFGGEVSVGEKASGASAAIAAANAAKEAAEAAARAAAAEAESTKQLLASLQKQMEEMKLAQQHAAEQNAKSPARSGKGKTE